MARSSPEGKVSGCVFFFLLIVVALSVFEPFSEKGFAQSSGAETGKATSDVQSQADKSIENARQQLEKLQKEFEGKKAQEQGLNKDISVLENQRLELNQMLIQSANRIKQSEARLSLIEGKIAKLSETEQAKRKQMQKNHGEVSRMLAIMQRMGRQPPPVMATHRDDALKMVRSAMLLSTVFPQLKQQADHLAQELTGLVQTISENRVNAAQLRVETEKLNKEREHIKNLHASKKSKILAYQGELGSVREAAERYSKNAQNLEGLITKLDQEVSDKAGLGSYQKELESGSSGLQSGVDPATGQKIELVPGEQNKKMVALVSPARIKPAISFDKAKGLLPLPASGQRLRGFGEPDQFGAQSKGIALKTRDVAQITAPCDGWIVYSGPFRSYGQLLIINAGGGYHILLAGMEKIDVVAGQFVLAGEPVATMGLKQIDIKQAESGQKPQDYDQTLYIEFRHNGQPIDPDPWWMDGNRKAQG